MTSPNASPIGSFSSLISATKANVLKCIDSTEHTEVISGANISTKMHYLKFDGNGKPMVDALAEYMYQHVIDYCLSARSRQAVLTPQESTRLTKNARKLFITPPMSEDDPDQTGEAGELLLYLLLETMLDAPQVVAKMELKTNAKLEVNGSDGIHMAWNDQDALVDIFFGESKIYQDLGAAMTAALKSVDQFHDNDMCRHEFLMVTTHFKHANDEIKNAVKELLADGVPTDGVRINHACLIGYNWSDYKDIFSVPSSDRLKKLQETYLSDAKRIHDICSKKLAAFKNKHVRLHVFFLPFEKVQDFRDAFNKAMG